MFKIYKASAGSGKTTHLVAEYLSICFSHTEKYKNILAVTFTNNATAEMKERIISTLSQFAFMADPDSFHPSEKAIFRMISENMKLDAEEAHSFIRSRSLKLLREILYHYDHFSISTIDSFFQRLLRSFALDLDLNLHFQLEINLEEFFTQTIDLLLNKISKKEKQQEMSLSEQVLQLVDKNLSETGKNNIERELWRMLYYMYDEEAFFPLEQIEKLDINEIKEYCRELVASRKKLKKSIIDLAREGQSLVLSTGLEEDKFYFGKNGPCRWFSKVMQNPDHLPSCYMEKAIERGCFTKEPHLIGEEVHSRWVEIYRKIIALHPEYKAKFVLSQNLDSFVLLFDLKKIMNEIKQHDNLFYLSETNAKIYNSIRHEEAPYLYEKLGNRYSYFLIDEFQDTSNMQWQNLLPLVKNAISGANHFGELGRTVLFGDVKQAIYRFRNGDASLLNRLSTFESYRKEMGYTITDPENYILQPLQVNYRSATPIIEFNNRFFRFLTTIPDKDGSPLFKQASDYYKDVEQKAPDFSEKEGFVSICFKTDEEEDYMEKEIINALQDALSRNFNYRDIAILTKDKKSGSRYGKILSSHRIPVISSESLLLESSEKIRLLIASLKFLINENDEIAKLVLLHHLDHRDESVFSESVRQVKENSDFRKILQSFGIFPERKHLLSLPFYTLIQELIANYGFRETDPFIVSFLDEITRYSSAKNAGVSDFLNWWESHKEKLSVSSSKEMNAVTITTIHKAKGLQYPVVILPLNQYSASFTKKIFWHHDNNQESGIPYFPITISTGLKETPFEDMYEQESALSKIDNLNTLYVAHTRPCSGFYIITGKKDRGNYSRFLDQFICDQPGSFVSSEAKPNQFWYGNKNYRHENPMQPENNSCRISQIHTSSFNPLSDDLLLLPPRHLTMEQKEGLEIHEFLSSMAYFPVNGEEMEKCLVSFSEDKKGFARSVITRIMEDPFLRPYFSPGATVLNETVIIDSDGKSYRPDRISRLEDKILIIDYKTGRPSPEDEKQLENYVALVKEMGYENVNGKLLYLSDPSTPC